MNNLSKLCLKPTARRWRISEKRGIVELVMASHAGMTGDDFSGLVRDWIGTAKHPRFDRPYTQCVYQPMLELLAYLRSNGFKTFIVSESGVEFMRVWTEPVCGIPAEQVIGSTIRTRYELKGDRPVLMRLPEVDFIDDKAGKPVGIGKFLGAVDRRVRQLRRRLRNASLRHVRPRPSVRPDRPSYRR